MRYEDLLSADELDLKVGPREGERRLAFGTSGLPYREWAGAARERLAALLGLPNRPDDVDATVVRTVTADGVRVEVVRLRAEPGLSLPGYLLAPADGSGTEGRIVLALHGHGEVEAALAVDGVDEDYHHRFAHRLAVAGHRVFVPELRGFGALSNPALQLPGTTLRYWRWDAPMSYSLQTDAFLYGRSMLGETIADLRQWEAWLAASQGIETIDVVGISWGGDLACSYPIFSDRVGSIFASGSRGSFTEVFRTAGNAPAHCLPGVLQWLDRSDLAGLNAPTPIAAHYGELDVPGPDNHSAAYNDSVPGSIAELRAIYAAAGGPEPELIISAGLGHEMDLTALTDWLLRQTHRS